MSAKVKTHALLVAIQAYDERITLHGNTYFPQLHGAKNDAEAIRKYLEEDPNTELVAHRLYDSDATKTNIVKAFQTQLAKAKEGENILIYFSGHGTVEEADPRRWPGESDGRLECLVCHYSEGDSGKFLLADKELRYLLDELSQRTAAHILAVFDCCHSGDNTRAATSTDATRKQIDIIYPRRRWQDFIFHQKFDEKQVPEKGIAALLPEGKYVQIAACESNEPALEVSFGGTRHGLLTYYLLQNLRETGGRISYQNLVSRVRNQIRFRYSQRPKIYVPSEVATLAHSGFLQKTPDATFAGGTAAFDNRSGYLLDRGTLHRVKSGKTQVQVRGNDKNWHPAQIGEVLLDHSALIFEDPDAAWLADTMPARLEKLDSRRLQIRLLNHDADAETAQKLLDRLTTPEMSAWVEITESAERLDYDLLCWSDMFYITPPDDWFRPVALPADSSDANAIEHMAGQIEHLARWHFTKDLKNDSTDVLPFDLLDIEFLDENNRPLLPKNDVLTLELGESKGWERTFKVRLTNRSTQNLHVAVNELSVFGCDTNYLLESGTSTLFEPGESKFLAENENFKIEFSLDENARLFNLLGSDNPMQFIISSERFDTDTMWLDLLPEPQELLGNWRDAERGNRKDRKSNSATAVPKGWNARVINIHVPNPKHNQIDQNWLKAMMTPPRPSQTNPELLHFLLGLYFEKKPGLGASYQLKSQFLAAAEKGGFLGSAAMNIANTAANWRRNNRFRKMKERKPNAPRFLSEGDSWFQHPLLTDIIDQIGQQYPVYCLAAAGDTIENYFNDGELFKKLEEMKPDLLILSGGGNDILGDEMPSFLFSEFYEAEEGTQTHRFFAKKFFDSLDNIQAIYRQIFQKIRRSQPELPILVHSYDYPRPVLPESKEKNWLGERFDDKNISRLGDRTAAVHFMMDEFNQRLNAVAREFSNVHYLDLRQLVGDSQWDDEIHPNNIGFERVSAVFLRKIAEIFPGRA